MMGRIRMLPISGVGPPSTLASAVPQKNSPAMPRLIALDAVSIVYASSMDGKIYRLAK
jgi:hypothetical protein